MSEPHRRWQRPPRPNEEVVRIIRLALQAAERGSVRRVTIVVVNPLYEVEHTTGGDSRPGYGHAMIGGLSAASRKILKEIDPD